MAFEINGKLYSSKKHPMLEYIFRKYNPNNLTDKSHIRFTLKDISEGYRSLGIPEPASISNTILDLTRKKRPISSRLPQSIYSLGYDLRKKTGINQEGESFAGEFVFVGIGIEIESWLSWPQDFPKDCEIEISSVTIPPQILRFIRNDEGALFSIIDYCDVLSKALNQPDESIYRIQNPLKWQPNEIDGFYYGENINGESILYPVEAKALTTGDDINLEQMLGAIKMMHHRYQNENVFLCPLAVRMIPNGIQLAVFENLKAGQEIDDLKCVKKLKILFNPKIVAWS